MKSIFIKRTSKKGLNYGNYILHPSILNGLAFWIHHLRKLQKRKNQYCNQSNGNCRCLPGVIGKSCTGCPRYSVLFIKTEENEEPSWLNNQLNQFDYKEGCFSCYSMEECQEPRKDCPCNDLPEKGKN